MPINASFYSLDGADPDLGTQLADILAEIRTAVVAMEALEDATEQNATAASNSASNADTARTDAQTAAASAAGYLADVTTLEGIVSTKKDETEALAGQVETDRLSVSSWRDEIAVLHGQVQDWYNELQIGQGLMPAGGASGDVLVKQSATDFDAVWEAKTFANLNDVDLTSDPPIVGDGIVWDGAKWVPGLTGEVEEAPTDGSTYARRDGGWTPFTPTKRARVELTTPWAIPSVNVEHSVSFASGSAVVDVGGWFNAATPNVLTVPSGVTHVIFSFAWQSDISPGTNAVDVFLNQNGSVTHRTYQRFYSDGWNGGSVTSGVLNVVPGDTLEVRFISTKSFSLRAGRTYMSVLDVSGAFTGVDGLERSQADALYAAAAHTHPWSDLSGVPASFTPSAHSHAIGDVTGLQTALDGKSSTTHLHDDRYAQLNTAPVFSGLEVANPAAYMRLHETDQTGLGAQGLLTMFNKVMFVQQRDENGASNTNVARFDPVGSASPDALTVVTREKGDARYALTNTASTFTRVITGNGTTDFPALQIGSDVTGFWRSGNTLVADILGVPVMRIEGAGTTTSDGLTAMTREKSDARYLLVNAENWVTGSATVLRKGLDWGPNLVLHQTSASTNASLKFTHAGVAGDITLDFRSLDRLGIRNETSNTTLAQFEAAGTTSPVAQSVITREKGDARYTLASSGRIYKDAIADAPTPDLSSLTRKTWTWGGVLAPNDPRYGEPGSGLLADDVAAVVPEAVRYDELGRPAAIDALTMIGALVAAHNALTARVAALEAA